MCFPVHPVAELGNCLLKKKPGGMPLFSILKRRRWRRPSLLPMVRPERAPKCLSCRSAFAGVGFPRLPTLNPARPRAVMPRSFDRAELLEFVASVWPLAEENPDAAFWAQEFIRSGHGNVTA